MKDSFKELTYPEMLAKREELRKQYSDLCANAIIGHFSATSITKPLIEECLFSPAVWGRE